MKTSFIVAVAVVVGAAAESIRSLEADDTEVNKPCLVMDCLPLWTKTGEDANGCGGECECQAMCCDSMDATCQACSECKTVKDFCSEEKNAVTTGCDRCSDFCTLGTDSASLACSECKTVEDFCSETKNADVQGCEVEEECTECCPPGAQCFDPDAPCCELQSICEAGCKSYSDGCNTCQCLEGKPGACTEMFCSEDAKGTPKCLDEPPCDAICTEGMDAASQACRECKTAREFCNEKKNADVQGCDACPDFCTEGMDATSQACSECKTVEEFCSEKDNAQVQGCEEPPPPDCATVRCASAQCAEGQEAYTPDGECCEQCRPITVESICEAGCQSYSDGCNTCQCHMGMPWESSCTEMECFAPGTPECLDCVVVDCAPLWTKTGEDKDGCGGDCVCEAGCTTGMDASSLACSECKTVEEFCSEKGNAQVQGCEEPLFNCVTKEVWTPEKKKWCCENKKMGCPPDCATVRCASAQCAEGQEAYTPDGECCEKCRPITVESICEAGCKSYSDGCNTCQCPEDGMPGMCTKMFCSEDTKGTPKCLDEPEPCYAVCCMAADATCMACSECKTVNEFCTEKKNINMLGCPGNPDITGAASRTATAVASLAAAAVLTVALV